MKWNEIHLKFKLTLYIVLGVILVLSVTTGVIISTVTSQEEELAYQQSIEQARSYANQFDSDMNANKAIARTLAISMSSYEGDDRAEVNLLLEDMLAKNPNLVGVYVGYEPDAFDGRDSDFINSQGHDSTGRFVPYWNNIGGEVNLLPLRDYESSDYYQLPKKLNSDVLTEPYFYEGIFLVSYVSPIMDDGEFVGIGGVDVALDYVDETVGQVKAFDTGYAFMTGNTGILMSHPEYKGWIGSKTLYDFEVPQISEAADNIRHGKGGHIETVDPTTGKEVVMFYEPVETGNFSFILVIPKEEMLAGVTALRNELIIISSISIVFMAGVAYLIVRSVTNPINEIVYGFKRVADNAVKGKLDARADTDVQVDFKQIPLGLNEILDSVITPIRETVRVTSSLATGKLDTRLKMDVQGEFRQLGDTLDNFAEHLDTMINDSNAVLSSIQKEDFTRSIRIHGEGDFKKLTDGIEETRRILDNVAHERKEAQKALNNYARELEHSNELKMDMEMIVNSSPVVAFKWRASKGWPVKFVSDNVTQFGYAPEEFISGHVSYADIIHPEDVGEVSSELSGYEMDGSTYFSKEYRIFTKSGVVRWVDERTFIRRNQSGVVTHLQGIIVDITERKEAEEALRKTEEIRKKEIHHRIKNNLQVISSLLDLEAGNFKDEEVIEAFKESQNRVISMALVHEELYQSKDMESIDFGDYMRNLTNDLFQSYSVNTSNVVLEMNVDDIFLVMDTAIPLGIITNELISNALKHAFPHGRGGKISIDLHLDDNDRIVLVVGDTGVGFSQDIDFRETESLGLQLVTTLVDQIDGRIELDAREGTKFRIELEKGVM